MTTRDDDDFRPKVRAPKWDRESGGQRFVSRVLANVAYARAESAMGAGSRAPRGPAHFRRGEVAARFAGRGLNARSRRVIIKSLLVRVRATSRAAGQHLRYLVRDGVTREGAPGQAYDARSDAANLKAFEANTRGDRHQFRFIVSAEDAAKLEDLRPFTRELMQRMEADLGTRLEWIAVDPWDTDNPHTHVVLRGVDDGGRDLVIDREYLSHGMRRRACELASEWLGPRTELDVRQALQRDVKRQRWTDLDRELQACAKDGLLELRQLPTDSEGLPRRGLLIGRLQCLEQMGLSNSIAPGRWQLRRDAESVLRALGERGDIMRTMQRALGSERREHCIWNAKSAAAPVVGCIAGKGLADELSGRPYLVIDGLDGRAHYVTLASNAELTDLPVGAIVEAGPIADRAADRTIVALAVDGCYRPEQQLARLRAESKNRDPQDIVDAHIRRLEALRRTGVVERLSDDLWRVPNDLVERGKAYDRARLGDVQVDLHSHLSVEQQIRAVGATWLDRQLVDRSGTATTTQGFGAIVQEALRAREEFLVEQGLGQRARSGVVLRRDLLAILRARELESASQSIATETGLIARTASDGTPVSGVYRRSIMLASGRFAMLDDGLGFSLVRWRPVLEKRLGQSISAVVRGDSVSWQLDRSRGLGIG